MLGAPTDNGVHGGAGTLSGPHSDAHGNGD